MPFEIIRNDITKLKVDAIVNAANTALLQGGGVCGAIFEAAGSRLLQKACDEIGSCKTGEAVITEGFALPAKYIIHTVGPIWTGGMEKESQLLKNCYKNSLELAKKENLTSIAFPLISSGIYGYPKDQALHIAITAIGEFLMTNDMLVYLIVFDKGSLLLSERLFSNIEKYIDDNYVEEQLILENSRLLNNYELFNEDLILEEVNYNIVQPNKSSFKKRNLEDVLTQLEETFSQKLLRLIDEKGFTDVETYKRANLDRKLFSKIRSNKDYSPRKSTALALAIALELTLDETLDLLQSAGFSLSSSSKFDLIIQFFIEEGNFNIFEINEALFSFEQPILK